ncbi:MAG: hypothetical protein AWU57_492 [Marinobacter sp. T13-3]|nr:MAG: hypothetical protein AWU57_492 [Marinobacter sp. T13-3]
MLNRRKTPAPTSSGPFLSELLPIIGIPALLIGTGIALYFSATTDPYAVTRDRIYAAGLSGTLPSGLDTASDVSASPTISLPPITRPGVRQVDVTTTTPEACFYLTQGIIHDQGMTPATSAGANALSYIQTPTYTLDLERLDEPGIGVAMEHLRDTCQAGSTTLSFGFRTSEPAGAT